MISGSTKITVIVQLAAISLITFFPVNSSEAQSNNQAKSSCELRLEAYNKKRREHSRQSANYWNLVKKKRAERRKKVRANIELSRNDYVLTFPPEYKGPKKPKCPGLEPDKPVKKVKPKPLPTVSNFLRSAKSEYGFVPKPTTEMGYKIAVAREAVSVGLNADQIVGVFALETGGIGPYNRQSGIFITNQNCKPIKAKGRAASTALGYVQLLAANSAVVAYYNGRKFAERFEQMSKTVGPARAKELRRKANLLRKVVRDIGAYRSSYPKSKRNNWREFVSFGNTSKGKAVHALNLDVDIGPLLQVHKLLKIKQVANRKGYTQVSGAQIELMNLVGYGRGLEMMRPVARNVPTSNFFSSGGYFRNPVAKDRTSEQLLDRLDSIIQRNMKKCGSIEFLQAFDALVQR